MPEGLVLTSWHNGQNTCKNEQHHRVQFVTYTQLTRLNSGKPMDIFRTFIHALTTRYTTRYVVESRSRKPEFRMPSRFLMVSMTPLSNLSTPFTSNTDSRGACG